MGVSEQLICGCKEAERGYVRRGKTGGEGETRLSSDGDHVCLAIRDRTRRRRRRRRRTRTNAKKRNLEEDKVELVGVFRQPPPASSPRRFTREV